MTIESVSSVRKRYEFIALVFLLLLQMITFYIRVDGTAA